MNSTFTSNSTTSTSATTSTTTSSKHVTCEACHCRIDKIPIHQRRDHPARCIEQPCHLLCQDVDGGTLFFDYRQMYNHLKSLAHTDRQKDCDVTEWCSNYGRIPLSHHLELEVFANFQNETYHALHRPFRDGSTGCEQLSGPEEKAWQTKINLFHPNANFKAVVFDMKVSNIMNSLRYLAFGLLGGCSQFNFLPGDNNSKHVVVGIADGFVASDLYCSQAQNMVIIADNDRMIQELTALRSKQTIVAIVYDHMRYTNLTLRPVNTFDALYGWCDINGVALVCDETLSFLFRGPSFAFATDNDKLPDFVIIGKFASISALLATDRAIRLVSFLRDNVFNTNGENFQNYLYWANNLTTFRCDHITIQRSTKVLTWVFENKTQIIENIAMMNEHVPKMFGDAGLPRPSGHGFVWHFDEHACTELQKNLSGRNVLERLTFSKKIYFYIDTRPAMATLMLATCIENKTGKKNRRTK